MKNNRSLVVSYATLLGALLFASAGTAIASAQQQPDKTIPIVQSPITQDVMDSDADDDITKSPYQRAFEHQERLRARRLLLEVGP